MNYGLMIVLVLVVAAAAAVKWMQWELYGRPDEPSQDEKDYAAWFDA